MRKKRVIDWSSWNFLTSSQRWRYQIIGHSSCFDTHQQLNAEELASAGISKGTIRLSVGIEDVTDLIADLEQALEKI